VKLLFDQNLSRRLVAILADIYADSTRVALVGLDKAPDRDVWRCAGDNGYVIVSKDSDFGQLAFLYGRPPKVIWLRVGNQPTKPIGELLRAHAETISRFAASEAEALLVLPDLPQAS
jgi:predicted nuclease of predicted toxin-antitoxin system